MSVQTSNQKYNKLEREHINHTLSIWLRVQFRQRYSLIADRKQN